MESTWACRKRHGNIAFKPGGLLAGTETHERDRVGVASELGVSRRDVHRYGAAAGGERETDWAADLSRFLQRLGPTHCVINLQFRMEFTRAHFQLLGLGDEVVPLVSFDFLGVLAKSRAFQRGLAHFGELWLAGATRA